MMPPGRSEDIALQLKPGLIDNYANRGFCVVVVGSIQRGRAYQGPEPRPGRDRVLPSGSSTEARKVASFSPMKRGEPLPEFNFDWSYNYYPSRLRAARPAGRRLPAAERPLRNAGGAGGRTRAAREPAAAAAAASSSPTVPFLNPVRSRQRGDCIRHLVALPRALAGASSTPRR